jgi:hypothetical protein
MPPFYIRDSRIANGYWQFEACGADQIPDSEPGDVLFRCRRLCLLGKAIEGHHHARGRFRRIE